MKIRITLTLELPESSVSKLRATTTSDSQLRLFVRRRVAEAAQLSDWIKDLDGEIAIVD
jgi:hypothetical protein